VQPRLREVRADARVVERRLQELPLDRSSVRPVVGAAARAGLEVDRVEVVVARAVAGGEDLAGAGVGLAPLLVDREEPLVEDRELVAAMGAAGEVHVPGEDLGEVGGELRPLAELLDGRREAARHDAGQAHLAPHERRLVARRREGRALALDLPALARRALVHEALDLAGGREHEAEAVARLRVAEVEHGTHLAHDDEDAVGG
jgi:hypothetical protein